jgi:hypothetical protein
MREFLPQPTRRVVFEYPHSLGGSDLPWQVNRQAHVIRHRLDLDHTPIELGDDLANDPLRSNLDSATQGSAPALRAPKPRGTSPKTPLYE